MRRNSIGKRRLAAVAVDFTAVGCGWFAFNVIRFFSLPDSMHIGLMTWLGYGQVILGQLLVPVLMVGIFAFWGSYGRRALMACAAGDTLVSAAGASFTGMMIVFFAALINDGIPERMLNYELMLSLFLCLFLPVATGRSCICRYISGCRRKGRSTVSTLLVGKKEDCEKMLRRLHNEGHPLGLGGKGSYCCGYDELEAVYAARKYDAVLFCSVDRGIETLCPAIWHLYRFDVPVFVSADNYNRLEFKSKVLNFIGTPFIDLTVPSSGAIICNAKRLSDIMISAVCLPLLSPLYAALAVIVRKNSPGGALFRQKRVGLHGKEFTIYKFRTMYADAEINGPRLSSAGDSRVTSPGRVLRKYRLDETLQFWNVLRGDMSIVGPRPERKYYVERLLSDSPRYALLYQCRPGITSMGAVRYGYASNIDEMKRRMEYDLIYVQNISVPTDIKVLLYTVLTVLKGKGV